MGQADKGREDAEAGWEGQVESDIGSIQAGGIDREDIEHRDGRVEEGEGAGWTGGGREGDLDNCNMGEMVEVGEQVTTAVRENRTRT